MEINKEILEKTIDELMDGMEVYDEDTLSTWDSVEEPDIKEGFDIETGEYYSYHFVSEYSTTYLSGKIDTFEVIYEGDKIEEIRGTMTISYSVTGYSVCGDEDFVERVERLNYDDEGEATFSLYVTEDEEILINEIEMKS